MKNDGEVYRILQLLSEKLDSMLEEQNEVCQGYCGAACVDGHCPKANAEEYVERDMDVICSCQECIYYKGCEDCFLYDTEYCILAD